MTTASAATYQGCPSGYACLYPQNAGWNGGHPEHTYYRYRSYNLSNEYGTHRFFNNQTGSARAYGCTGWNGTGTCPLEIAPWVYTDWNFTPINSIVLKPH